MIYTITSTLPPIHGGRTKSLLFRIVFMSENLGIKQKIITTNYNPEYCNVYKTFESQGQMTSQQKVENIYDWLSGYKLLKIPRTKITKREKHYKTPIQIKGYKAEKLPNKDVVRYYDKDGNYLLYRKYKKNSKVLEFEDFMNPISKKRIERWQYNTYGELHRKIIYCIHTQFRISEKLYDTQGHMYCEKQYENNKKNKISSIKVYKENMLYKVFKSEKDLFIYYFDKKFKEGDIVFNDARLLDRALLHKKTKTKNIIVYHSSHYSNGKLKKSYKTSLNNADKVARYIVLTENQKEDIRQIKNIKSEKIAVIPHFSQKEKLKPRKIRKEDRFVYIGRIAKTKQLDHLIKAYKKFKNKGYTTRLTLFGKDEKGCLKSLKELISELDLENDVEIYSYTDNPDLEFRKSKASFLTSKFEGFGLTVMESIAMGCPVIAYDIKYGPSEIIEHGRNGYLVPKDDIDELANRMMDIIDNPLKKVSNKKLFHEEQAIRNYKKLLKEIKAYKI